MQRWSCTVNIAGSAECERLSSWATYMLGKSSNEMTSAATNRASTSNKMDSEGVFDGLIIQLPHLLNFDSLVVTH